MLSGIEEKKNKKLSENSLLLMQNMRWEITINIYEKRELINNKMYVWFGEAAGKIEALLPTRFKRCRQTVNHMQCWKQHKPGLCLSSSPFAVVRASLAFTFCLLLCGDCASVFSFICVSIYERVCLAVLYVVSLRLCAWTFFFCSFLLQSAWHGVGFRSAMSIAPHAHSVNRRYINVWQNVCDVYIHRMIFIFLRFGREEYS